MTISRSKSALLLVALFTSAVLAVRDAAAQQVTYYNFNTPANSGQFSYSCSTANLSSNSLFCFNYQGSDQDPSFIPDPSPTYAVQMTYPLASQASSMWFSIPQKVAEGFNVWFQFKMTPSGNSQATADGIAFVVQNAAGGQTDTTPSACGTEVGSGPTVVGGGGGCIGYGSIDNSVALEFDTYQNGWDPDGNHIALQSCGVGNSNSPDHDDADNCLVTLPANGNIGPVSTLKTPTSSSTGNMINLADGQVHDVVITYNGPLDHPANTISVYIDPAYNPGTHTPTLASTPVFTGPFNIASEMSLSGGDSAYVGFTSATGFYFETNEVMAWTFTPHTTVTQQQPLNPPGTPTTFNFGTHTYTVNFPTGVQTSGYTMGVIANTISPPNFNALVGLGPTQYSGSACQVYDDTGGNCIIYSTYCYLTGSPSDVQACPAVQNPPTDCTSNINETNCILLTSSYNNSIQPTSPGYLKGDPLYSPVTSITGNGTTATVTCTGECSVTSGQTVTILDANDIPEFTGVTVTGATVNTLTFNSAFNGTDNGGYVTSNNVQDIFTSYSPESLDGSSTGKTTNVGSDFVVTGTTVIGTQMALSAPNNNNALENEAEELTATVSAPTTGPTGLILLSAQSIADAIYPGTTIGGTVSFSDNNGPVAYCQNVALTAVTSNNVTTYQAQCNYTPTGTGQDSLTAQYSGDGYHQPSSNEQTLTVSPQTVVVTVGTSPAGLSYDINNVPSNLTQMPTWNVGVNYTLSVPNAAQTLSSTPNTQYVFSQWSNGGTATDTVTAPATATTYTADFITQYLLDATAGPGGTVSVPAGNDLYYKASSSQTVTATPNPGYVFSGWSGTGSNQVSAGSGNSYNVAMNGPALITASFTAVPAAGVSPASINFGTSIYFGSIITKTVTITNTGQATMTISDPLIAIVQGGNSDEFITINLCPKSLAVGKSCIMTVTFLAGPFYTPQTATLKINDNAAGSPQTVMLSATVINPQAQLSAGSVAFGTAKTNSGSVTKFVTLTSAGGTALSIADIRIGADTSDFSQTNTCPTTPMNPKATCTISVTFKPITKGSHSGTLIVTDNAQNSPQSIPLSGTGN